MNTRTQQHKRRRRDAIRRAAELDAKHQHNIAEAKVAGFHEGHAAGTKSGISMTRASVLDHAGRLFKEGKDDAADAVRDVYRLLTV